DRGLEKINKSTGSEITLVAGFITESWLEEAKKEIRVCVERKAQMIVKEQKRMLTSLLEKLTSKVTIDRVYTEEAESAQLEMKPKEVLRITKEHFQNQVQENWYNSLLEPIELEEWEA
ncbi:17094_t:CDS:2, partial [Dentiscutata heterogama]